MSGVLARALSGARARTADDVADPSARVAATVVLLRDADEGPEVLLIQRPGRGTFAGAWVFPGGAVEPADAGQAEDAGEEAVARVAAVRETAEETGLVVDVGELITLSRWDPPPGIAVRFRTWFFVGCAPRGELRLQPDEAVGAAWARPVDVLRRHGHGELTLFPPTFVTLARLSAQPSVEAVLSEARVAGVRDFATQVREGGALLVWPGDAEDGARRADAAATTARHRLRVDALPWTYEHTA
ncbi:NUDIX hydrolase [Microbacterium sp. 1P10UB]|uniref:NUDIX hydrolase n=1 Tax=unclassified Microbacterium TaxID=2609290 RepID=UPI0039A03B5E